MQPKSMECFRCLYCDTDFESRKWVSKWAGSRHYKVNECVSCHKSVWSVAQFDGSGHDNFGKEGDLEKVVKHVEGWRA